MNLLTFSRLPATLILLVFLTQCAVTPVSFKRIEFFDRHERSRTDLHALMTSALDPDASLESAHALGCLVERWKKESLPAVHEIKALTSGAPIYQITFDSTSSSTYHLEDFDEISPATAYRVGRIQHHLRKGVGTPMTALRENRHLTPLDDHFPPEAITRSVTVIAEPGPRRGSVQPVRIRLLCPLQNTRVLYRGHRQPLAADFTVPWAALISRAGGLHRSRILDMLTATPKRQPRLYLMERYDPNKEPLIMIHGLLSTPLAWAELSNDLWGDPHIRSRYQIWHYHYNTSAPALYSARLLRNQLHDLRKMLDPDGDDPAMQKTTLLTHSMGGLIGKALTVRPGDAFWKAALTRDHKTLKLSAEDRTRLNDAFEWEPDPTIHRVIFIAVPHLGSSYADNWMGRIGSWLTHPPSQFQEFYARISADNPGAFNEEYSRLGRGELDSVSSLSPSQPTLRILASLPFARPIQAHSIIGNRGLPGPLEESSDGIVPYRSSHLKNAVSELIVPANHGAFRHPDALAEVLRILRL